MKKYEGKEKEDEGGLKETADKKCLNRVTSYLEPGHKKVVKRLDMEKKHGGGRRSHVLSRVWEAHQITEICSVN